MKEIDGTTKGGTDPAKAKPGTTRAKRIADNDGPSEISSALDEAWNDFHRDHPVHLFKKKHTPAEEKVYEKHHGEGGHEERAKAHSERAAKHDAQVKHASDVLASLPPFHKGTDHDRFTHRKAQDVVDNAGEASAFHKNAAAHHRAKSPHAHLASNQAHNGSSQDADYRHEELKKHLEKKDTGSKKHIGEEVEQVDEISKKTMGSYINHAVKDVDDHSYDLGHRDAAGEGAKKTEYSEKKVARRIKGIARAVRKLTKEESEKIDETKDLADAAYKAGVSHGLLGMRRSGEKHGKHSSTYDMGYKKGSKDRKLDDHEDEQSMKRSRNSSLYS